MSTVNFPHITYRSTLLLTPLSPEAFLISFRKISPPSMTHHGTNCLFLSSLSCPDSGPVSDSKALKGTLKFSRKA